MNTKNLPRLAPLILLLSGLALLFLMPGCSSVNRALLLSQSIQGNGSVTIETPVTSSQATLEGARQEDGKFKADKLDLVHKGKLSLTRVEIHLTDYSRPLISPETTPTINKKTK